MADLTTLAALEERLAITGTNPTDSPDEYLENLIDRASAFVENSIIGRTVTQQAAVVEYVDGTSRFLNLRNGPINSISSVRPVTYSGGAAVLGTALTELDDFFIRGLTTDGWKLPGYLEANGSFLCGVRNYKVTFDAGWATIPEDIEDACLTACVFFKNQRRDTGTSSRDVGAGSLSGFRTIRELADDLKVYLAAYIDPGWVKH